MDDYQHGLLINQAASLLPPAHFKDFKRLARELEAYRGRWGLFFVKYQHQDDIAAISAALLTLMPQVAEIHASAHTDVMALEQAMQDAVPGSELIHLRGMDDWLGTRPDASIGSKRLLAWNISREYFANAVPRPILCWLRPETLQLVGMNAPDLWSWRAGVHEFFLPHDNEVPETSLPEISILPGEMDNRTLAQRTQRIHDLQHYLQQPPPEETNVAAWRMRALLIDELAQLQFSIGETQLARRMMEEEVLPIYWRLDDAKKAARAASKIADWHLAAGDAAAALNIWQNRVLPAFELLQDTYNQAAIQLKIANIHAMRGDLEEARALLEQQILPASIALKNDNLHAAGQMTLAIVARKQDKPDEALNLLQTSVLPYYESERNHRQIIIALQMIADLLLQRGQWHPAMELLQSRAMQSAEELGDVHLRAETRMRIAGILMQRGDLSAAIELIQSEILPTYEALGLPFPLQNCRRNLAWLLVKRHLPQDLIEARQLLMLAQQATPEINTPGQTPIPDLLAQIDALERSQLSLLVERINGN